MTASTMAPKTSEQTNKARLVEFDLYISKAVLDKKTGEMRWSAVASDTEMDSYGDNMSLGLFDDFIRRIEADEKAPEQFRSSVWQGGMPYLSVSHYSDQNGKGLPGEVTAVYVDGARLKSKGIFHDTERGRACFDAVRDDLYADDPRHEKKVRISIGFLDWAHEHKSKGTFFERQSVLQGCPDCKEKKDGKVYKQGQLIHLALTRVPVNERTLIELEERAMGTRKEDAASIVGEEDAEELEKQEKMVGKSEALIERSEETVKSELPDVVIKHGPTSIENMVASKEAGKTDLWQALSDVVYNIFSAEIEDKKSAIKNAIEEFKSMLVSKSIADASKTPLDKAWFEFTEELSKADGTSNEKLRNIQPAFERLGQAIVENVSEDEVEVEVDGVPINQFSEALERVLEKTLTPLFERLALIEQSVSKKEVKQPTAVRRSIVPQLTPTPEHASTRKLSRLSEMVNRSVGLSPEHARLGVLVTEK